MPTIVQTEKIAADRLEETCSWAFQSNLRFGHGGYQSCLGALDNVIKVAKEAITLVKNIEKEREGKRKKFLKSISKSNRKKSGLSGKGKTVKRKTNAKRKRTRKGVEAGNKKKPRKVR
jgi:hypothetical protein